MKGYLFLVLVLLLLVVPQKLHAQIPSTLPYQGVLTDTSGTAKTDGSYSFTFKLYEAASGGSSVWSETKSLTLKKGLFSTMLGDATAFGSAVTFNKPYWLSIQVGSDAEITQRIQLASSAYSLNSLKADTAQYVKNGGVTFPFGYPGSSGSTLFAVSNSSTGAALYGSSAGVGIWANSTGSNALYAVSSASGYPAIYSSSSGSYGILGKSTASGSFGVYGEATGGDGIYGTSSGGNGVYGQSSVTNGVSGFSSASGYAGVYANSNASYGLWANSSASHGIFSASSNGAGVFGRSTGGGAGVYGESGTGSGVSGYSTAYGYTGVYGESTQGSGVWGKSTGTNWHAVRGDATTGAGVYGNSVNGNGVKGYSDSVAGVYGQSLASNGVYGFSQYHIGVYATSNDNIGLYSNSYYLGSAIKGYSRGTYPGLYSVSDQGNGVEGYSNTNYAGVYGRAYTSVGIHGQSQNGSYAAVYGNSGGLTAHGWAGSFWGGLTWTGSSFGASNAIRIDHPTDPENKYLYHASVSSPDMKNIYDGVIILDKAGEAVVKLPDYFSALNKDFRYQLTPIGSYSPVYIATEVANNTFKIAGGKSGQKISWTVTGIRNDAFAQGNRVEVEETKSETERGHYIHPDAFGKSLDLGIDPEKMRSTPKRPSYETVSIGKPVKAVGEEKNNTNQAVNNDRDTKDSSLDVRNNPVPKVQVINGQNQIVKSQAPHESIPYAKMPAQTMQQPNVQPKAASQQNDAQAK